MLIVIMYPRFWQNPLGNLMLHQIALRRFSLETCVIISTRMPRRKELRFAWRTSFVFSISKFAACSPLVHSLLVQLGRWTFSTRDTVSSFSPRPTWRIAQKHSGSRIDKMLSIRYTFNIQNLIVLTTTQTLVLRASHWDDSSRDVFGSFSPDPTWQLDRLSPGYHCFTLSPFDLADGSKAPKQPDGWRGQCTAT